MSEVPATFILDASLPACAYAVVITVIRMLFVSAQMYPSYHCHTHAICQCTDVPNIYCAACLFT